MVDVTLVYVVGVLVLFFFWIYGVVAFLRDVKSWLVPAYRQWRSDEGRARSELRERPDEASSDVTQRPRKVDE